MKPKHRRLRFVLLSLACMATGAAGMLYALRENMVFFYTPTQWVTQRADAGVDTQKILRIGGLVKLGSVVNRADGGVDFVVTDLVTDIPATYRGLLPSLFREGQGVVAQGRIDASGVLVAQTILAKHDETYMPREVVEALKASGRWQAYGDAGKKAGRSRAP